MFAPVIYLMIRNCSDLAKKIFVMVMLLASVVPLI